MPICYQLVGVPGSGKSTWIKQQNWALGMTVVSTDFFVEQYAQSLCKSYSEVFDEYMPTAVKLMTDAVINARERSHDIIWDQTSVSVNSRKRKFNMLPNYLHVAVVFKTPEHSELIRRLDSRPGKIIPFNVVKQMAQTLEAEMPTRSEGFKEIIICGN
jgi:predicted kinase